MERLTRMREEEVEINESGITVDYQIGASSSSSDLLEDCYPASSAKWTNEKHCLYLKSMEASFVNQLHSSMTQLRNEFDSSQFLQIKTCEDILGFGKYGSESGAARTRKFHDNAASCWIKRYRSGGINQDLRATVSGDIRVNHDQEFESMFKPLLRLVRNSQQSRTTQSVLSKKNAVANNTDLSGFAAEMMGQNFDGNDQVIESNMRRAKRKKTETTSNEDNDQVVPISIPKR